ncbi:glycosyltransferase family 2 protein [Pedobacter puniceum]|uniref:Glycosyltransferase n=1 Tax=Pedobacter puniceum TaxID=2666136 RepID=A0A7K0FI67_9SPHI|nr:glycosyltransferase family 2 protein [Pedobacter puniceum]MRX45679.1 glycosyltransferase [Pedobacter puniceum]
MKVATIIVTYNGEQWIERCINSLIKSSKKIEIIVIDNGSKDNTLNIIENKYPSVKLLEKKENLGFGAANNLGIQYALNSNTDYVFLLNQDAWVHPDTIEVLISTSYKDKSYGILSPIHLNGKGTALDKNFSHHINSEDCPGLISDFILNSDNLKDIYPIKFTNAAAWLITRECLEIVGGFNPSFFHYGEDNNYVHRVHFHNLKIGIVPTVFINHDREDRGNNEYFNEINDYKRSIIEKTSNPNLYFSIARESRSLIFTCLKNILFKRKTFKISLQKLIFLTKLDYETLALNLKKSKGKKAFLN